MKQWLVVFFSAFAGLASAQSVNWSAAWSGCSAESRTFDAVAQGSSTNSQGVRGWVESHTGSPSTNIDGLQRKLEEDRELLRSHKDPVIRASAQLAICGSTAALNQLQSGTTQSSAPARRSGRDRPDRMASHCLEFSNSKLRNNCNQRVVVTWCIDDYGTHACGNGNLGLTELSPSESTYHLAANKAYWFACVAPARPSEVEYLPGRGLQAACAQ